MEELRFKLKPKLGSQQLRAGSVHLLTCSPGHSWLDLGHSITLASVSERLSLSVNHLSASPVELPASFVPSSCPSRRENYFSPLQPSSHNVILPELENVQPWAQIARTRLTRILIRGEWGTALLGSLSEPR